MDDKEYKRQLAELDRRFDGEIAEAKKRLEKAHAATEAARRNYEAWRQEAAQTVLNHNWYMFTWERADSETKAHRGPLDAATADEHRAADLVQSLQANKRSRVKKIIEARSVDFLHDAKAQAAAMAEAALQNLTV